MDYFAEHKLDPQPNFHVCLLVKNWAFFFLIHQG